MTGTLVLIREDKAYYGEKALGLQRKGNIHRETQLMQGLS
jgi:hypothetical protein